MRYKSFVRVDGMNAAEISKKVKDHAASPVNTNGIAQVTSITIHKKIINILISGVYILQN